MAGTMDQPLLGQDGSCGIPEDRARIAAPAWRHSPINGRSCGVGAPVAGGACSADALLDNGGAIARIDRRVPISVEDNGRYGIHAHRRHARAEPASPLTHRGECGGKIMGDAKR